MSRRKRTLIAFAIVDTLMLAVIVGILIFRNGTDQAANDLADLGAALLPDQPVLSDFALLDHNGERFSKQDLMGNWNLLFFGFTSCPDVCPLTMNVLKLFYDDLAETEYGDSTQVIMVSVDPQRDTVEAMANYVQQYHPEFVGLTGEHAVISKLADELYIAFREAPAHEGDHNPENYEIAHSGYIVMINPDGDYISLIRAPHTKERLTEAYRIVREI
jgi:protein SCO1/2